MKKLVYFVVSIFFISSCGSEIKNQDAQVIQEKGTEVAIDSSSSSKNESAADVESSAQKEETSEGEDSQYIEHDPSNPLVGYWVGYFRKDSKSDWDENTIAVDDGFVWNRENKINISIDWTNDSMVKGHSVVAGNDRPFEGSIKEISKGVFEFKVKEPGDDKYDGEFNFTIANGELKGKWTAYKNIQIKHRKYTLEKKEFEYDPDVMLEYSREYVNWKKVVTTKETVEYDEGEFEEWIRSEFATATGHIYKINASNTLLKKEDVENLVKGDLTIIRNAIYARHGYSFRNRPLRVFFDAQKWYIPVHTNIKADFTSIEKENIKLLLRYEKNAAEYYDSFGRG